jgi:hypothetical protein
VWDGKTPAIKWSRYQDRRQTAADIAELFRDDDSNIAILTGVISAVVVIDADSPQAMAWCARRLPWTPWQTRTAKGYHVFYAHPADVRVSNRARIERRTDDWRSIVAAMAARGLFEQHIRPNTLKALAAATQRRAFKGAVFLEVLKQLRPSSRDQEPLALVGEPEKVPPARFAQAWVVAIALGLAWNPDHLTKFARRFGVNTRAIERAALRDLRNDTPEPASDCFRCGSDIHCWRERPREEASVLRVRRRRARAPHAVETLT